MSLSGRPPLSRDTLVPRTETPVDRLLPGSLSVRVGAYKTLHDRFGAGDLADRLLTKWLTDPDADAKWDRLYAVVMVDHTYHPLKRAGKRPFKYWVVLWYFSMGYRAKDVAEQLDISIETVRSNLSYVRLKLDMIGVPLAAVVAKAIRWGLIP